MGEGNSFSLFTFRGEGGEGPRSQIFGGGVPGLRFLGEGGGSQVSDFRGGGTRSQIFGGGGT